MRGASTEVGSASAVASDVGDVGEVGDVGDVGDVSEVALLSITSIVEMGMVANMGSSQSIDWDMTLDVGRGT